MNNASTFGSTEHAATRTRAQFPAAAVGGGVATVVNLAVWTAGRMAGVSFLVTPVGATAPTPVGALSVGLTTVIAYAVGTGLFALAGRHSGRWARAVLVAGVVVAVVSPVGPLLAAEDITTGVLLTTMHLVTGAAFITSAKRRFQAQFSTPHPAPTPLR